MKIGLMGTQFASLNPKPEASDTGSQTFRNALLFAAAVSAGPQPEPQKLMPEISISDLLLGIMGEEIGTDEIRTEDLDTFFTESELDDWREAIQVISQRLDEILPGRISASPLPVEPDMFDLAGASVKVAADINLLQAKDLTMLPEKELAGFIRMVTRAASLMMADGTEDEGSLNEQLQQLTHQLKELKQSQRVPFLPAFQSFPADHNGKVLDSASGRAQYMGQLQGVKLTDDMTPAADGKNGQTFMNSQFETAVLHLSEKSVHQPNARQFMRDFGNMLAKANFSTALNSNKLLVRLYPEELGSLRIELLQKDGIMTARMLASTMQAKEMLDSQLHSLRQAFVQQNIQVDKIEVAFGSQEALKYGGQGGNAGGSREQRQEAQENSHESQDKRGFTDTLNDILLEAEV